MIPDRRDERISDEDLRAFKNELQERCILQKGMEETLRWGYTQKGSFSIKEAYNIKIRNQAEEDEIWEKIWLANPWPKVATFCWLVVKQRILKRENPRQRGIQGLSQCILCANQEESMNHLLDTCPFVADLWDRGAQMFRKSNRYRGDPSQTLWD